MADFFLKNGHIDTSVQKGGIPGVPGCLEHTGVVPQLLREARENKDNLVVLWLDLAQWAYGSMPHKLVLEMLERHHVPASMRDLIWDYYNEIQLERLNGINNIWVLQSGGGNHHRLYHLCDPVCFGNEHVSKICRTGMQRSQVQVRDPLTANLCLHGQLNSDRSVEGQQQFLAQIHTCLF